MGPLLFLLYINDFPCAIEDYLCTDYSHSETETLFGENCVECGNLMLYTDDGLYVTRSKSRNTNQDNIKDKFHKIKDYLNTHGLQINESKTVLSDIMSTQK